MNQLADSMVLAFWKKCDTRLFMHAVMLMFLANKSVNYVSVGYGAPLGGNMLLAQVWCYLFTARHTAHYPA